MNSARPCAQHTLVTIQPAGEQLPSRHAPRGVAGEGESLMTEEPGRYDRHPRQPPSRSSEPEPLGELLRQYVEDRHWDHLLTPSSSNGHQPADRTTVRHHDG